MAAALSGLREQIQQELSCSICLELFTRPKVLPCQHTFCQDCLQDHAGREATFKCPNCRRQVNLSPQGVAGLPDNHLVTSLCATLEQQSKLVEETSGQLNSTNRCSLHPAEKLENYCKQCQIPICEWCLEDSHLSHHVITIYLAEQERKSTVQALITKGRKCLETYCRTITDLREEEKNLNKQKQQTDNSIIQAYNHTVQKLTKGKDHLLAEVEENHRKNFENIQKERDRVLADVNELSAACNQAEHELEHGAAGSYVQANVLKEVVDRNDTKPSLSPLKTQPATFQPTETRALVLGHLTVNGQPLSSVPTPALIVSDNSAARGKGHHRDNSNQRQELLQPTDTSGTVLGQAMVQSPPRSPNAIEVASSNSTATTVDHHLGNEGQGENQGQRVTFGGRGSEPGQFRNPTGVTVSDEGEILVADCNNERIQVFTLQGTFVRQFPTVVPFEEQNMRPQGVALDREGNLWVVGWTDSLEFAVQYTKRGRVLRKIHLKYTRWFRGITVDTKKDRILVTQTTGDKDNLRGKVQVFRSDGTLAETLGSHGTLRILLSKQQGMKFPRYITVDGEGNILVSDRGNHCVCVYNEDGQFLFQFGEGSGEGQLFAPRGICTDRAGNIIVAEGWNSRVELFDKTGRFFRHIATDMKGPQAVGMATDGQLVVTDGLSDTVSILKNY